MSEKNGLVKNASFLMMATLISRVIGLLYRSPLGVVLGTVGLGYYGYANNVYVILLLISAYRYSVPAPMMICSGCTVMPLKSFR